MKPIDYTGETGGMMALAFAAGWSVATALWMAVAATVWKLFLEPRIKALEAARDDDKRRIQQLETLLLTHSSGSLRQAMQRVVSEQRIAGDME